jgi:hypothetical protein
LGSQLLPSFDELVSRQGTDVCEVMTEPSMMDAGTLVGM